MQYDRSHYSVENAINRHNLYVLERRRKFVPVTKLRELFEHLGIMAHPDNLLRVCGYEIAGLETG